MIFYRVRGTLGSTIVLNCNFGILLAFVLGDYCDFYTTPKFVIVLTCVFTILFYFFPESPSFLMKQCRDAVNVHIIFIVHIFSVYLFSIIEFYSISGSRKINKILSKYERSGKRL